MYSQKLITASFGIGAGSQGSGGTGQVTLSGLRMNVDAHLVPGTVSLTSILSSFTACLSAR